MRTTALASLVAPVILGAYSRRAYAACTTNGASVYNPSTNNVVGCTNETITSNFTIADTVSGVSLTLDNSGSNSGIYVYGDANTISLLNGSTLSDGIVLGDGTNIANGNIVNITDSFAQGVAGIGLDDATNSVITLDNGSLFGAAGISFEGYSDTNTITLNNASAIGGVSNAIDIGAASDDNTITLNAASYLTSLTGSVIDIDGDRNRVSLAGNSRINIAYDGYAGVYLDFFGNDNIITLGGNSRLQLMEAIGTSTATTHGIKNRGTGGTFNLQDSGRIDISLSAATGEAIGIELGGYSTFNTINIYDYGQIFTSSTNASGILINGVAGTNIINILEGHADVSAPNINAVGTGSAAIRLSNSGGGPFTNTINMDDGAYIYGTAHAIIVSGKSRAIINLDGRDGDGDASEVRVVSGGITAIELGAYDDELNISGTVSIDGDIRSGAGNLDEINIAGATLDMNNSYIDDVANITISGNTTITDAKINTNAQLINIANNADVVFAGDDFRIRSTSNENGGNRYDALTIDTKINISLTLRDDSVIEALGDQGRGLYVKDSDYIDISLDGGTIDPEDQVSVIKSTYSYGIHFKDTDDSTLQLHGFSTIVSDENSGVLIASYSNNNIVTLNDNSTIIGGSSGLSIGGTGNKIFLNDNAFIRSNYNNSTAIGVYDDSNRIYINDQSRVYALGGISPGQNATAIKLNFNGNRLVVDGGIVDGDLAAINVSGDNNIITLDARRNDVSLTAEQGTAISFGVYSNYNRLNVIDVTGDSNELVIDGDVTSIGDDMLGLGSITRAFTGALPATISAHGTDFIDFNNIALVGNSDILLDTGFSTNRLIIEDNNNTLTLMGDAAIVANTSTPNILVYDAFNTTINMVGTSALYSNVSGASGISVIPQNTEFGSQDSIQNRVKLLLNEGFYGVTGANVTEAVTAINAVLGADLSRPITASDFNNFTTLSALISSAIDAKYADDLGNKMAAFLSEVQVDSGLSSGNPLKLFVLPEHDIIINLNDSADILTAGEFSEGILLAFASGAEITLDDSALISTTGDASEGIDLFNSYDSNIILHSNAKILTTGSTETYNTSHGIALEDDFDTAITLNDNSYIKTTGANANAIYLNDSRNATITLNGANTALIAEGAATDAIRLENARYTSINIDAGTIYSKFGDGINSAGGYDNVFTLTNSAAVESDAAAGIRVADGVVTRINVTDSDIIGATDAIDGSEADSMHVTLISSGPPDEDGPMLNIVGNGGAAILFGDGNDRLTISGIGHNIDGDVIGGAGTDRLEFFNSFGGISDSSFITGFEQLELSGGTTFTMEDNAEFERLELTRDNVNYNNTIELTDTAHVKNLADNSILVNITDAGSNYITLSGYSYLLARDLSSAVYFDGYGGAALNSIILNDNAEITINGGSSAFFARDSDNNTIALNDSSGIAMNYSSFGFLLNGAWSNTITLNDLSFITTTGNDNRGFFIEGVSSFGNNITLNAKTDADAMISMNGSNNKAFLINNGAHDNTINIGTDSSVTSSLNVIEMIGAGALGIDMYAVGSEVHDNEVNITGFANIATSSGAGAIFVRGSNYYAATHNTINMSGNSRIVQSSTLDAVRFELGEDNAFNLSNNALLSTTGNNSDAISFTTTDDSNITLNNASSITTSGTGAAGIRLTDSDENDITLNNTANITSTNDRAISVTSAGGVTSNDIVLNSGTFISGLVGIEADANSHLDITLDGSTAAVSVTGTGGTAISLGNQNDYLRLIGTVVIDGDVLGGGGTDTLATEDLNLSLTAGSEISGFESFTAVGNNIFDIAGVVSQTLEIAPTGNNMINLLGTGKILTNAANEAGIATNDSSFNNINIYETASVETQQSSSHGIFLDEGSHNDVTISDDGLIETNGSTADGIRLNQTSDNDIGLSEDAQIRTYGINSHGIHLLGSVDNDMVLGGNTEIIAFGDGGNAVLLASGSESNQFILNDNALIRASGTTGSSAGLEINGSINNVLTLNGSSRIDGVYANAVNLTNADGTIVTLNGGDITASAGVAIKTTSSMATTNTIIVGNSSTISGETAIEGDANSALDITLDGSGGAVEVEGTDGVAINLGDLNDTLQMRGGVTSKGDILGGGGTDTLNFVSTTLTMNTNDVISGFEGMIFSGTNNVTGDIDATGTTFNVNSGGSLDLNGNLTSSNTTFIINGSLTLDTLTIGNGAFLQGNSNITANTTNIASGGTVAPGNSIGVTNITGNLNFLNGSALDIELDGNTADQVNVDGDIDINSGAILNFIPLSTFTGSNVDFLTATGAITGTFGTVNYNGSTVSLLYSSSAASVSSSLSLLSYNPSAFNSKVESTVANSLLFGDTIASEAAEGALRKGQHHWFRSLYRYTDRSTEGSYTGDTSHTYGIALGSEQPMSEHVKLGYSIANINSNSNINGALGKHQNNGVFGSLYSTYALPVQSANTFVTAGVLAGHQENDSKRLVSNSGVVSYAKSDSQDIASGGFAQIGVQLPMSAGWSVMPRTSITYLNTGMDGFAETEGGISNVAIDSASFANVKTAQSITLTNEEGIALMDKVKAHPTFELGLSQEHVVGNRDISGAFSNSTHFTTILQEQDKNFVNLGVGTKFTISDDATAFISYQGAFNSDEKRSNLRVGASLKF